MCRGQRFKYERYVKLNIKLNIEVSIELRIDFIVELNVKFHVELNSELDAERTLGRLDILVYGDMNSEPATHFLGYARLARLQAVFWGNPITTGKGPWLGIYSFLDTVAACFDYSSIPVQVSCACFAFFC